MAPGATPIPPKLDRAPDKIIYQLGKQLSRLECEVHVIDLKSPMHASDDSGITFHEVWDVPVSDRWFLGHVFRLAAFAVESTWELRRLIKTTKIDVIHTHSGQFTAPAVILANRLFRWKILVVHTTHNHDLVIYPNFLNKLKYAGELFALRNANYVIASVRTVNRQLVEKLEVDPSRIIEIPHGVETSEIDLFIHNHPLLQKDDSSVNVLCVSRICPRKNQGAVLEAMPKILKQFPQAKFIFVGSFDDGTYLKHLREFAAKRNIAASLLFTGRLSWEELFGLYQKATLFVFPTLYETQGLVLLEAMAFGVPVIASRIGPIVDITSMEANCAMLVNPLNADEIADATIELLKQDTLRRKMSAKGKELVARLSWEKIGQQTFKMYESIIKMNDVPNK